MIIFRIIIIFCILFRAFVFPVLLFFLLLMCCQSTTAAVTFFCPAIFI